MNDDQIDTLIELLETAKLVTGKARRTLCTSVGARIVFEHGHGESGAELQHEVDLLEEAGGWPTLENPNPPPGADDAAIDLHWGKAYVVETVVENVPAHSSIVFLNVGQWRYALKADTASRPCVITNRDTGEVELRCRLDEVAFNTGGELELLVRQGWFINDKWEVRQADLVAPMPAEGA